MTARPSTAAPPAPPHGAAFRRGAVLALVLLLGGCGPLRPDRGPRPTGLEAEVRRALATGSPTVRVQEAWERFEAMGPELDSVLVVLARDRRADVAVRANAISLLADRAAPAALPALREVLLTATQPAIRSTALIGLQRIGAELPEVQQAIRAATRDRAWQVRMHALQALDPMDVGTLRRVLATDRDGRVRGVARQVLALAETYGAPLARDEEGVFAGVALPGRPRLLLRPTLDEPERARAVGDLSVQMPNGQRLPLALGVLVVGDVVPAFLSPDQRHVVFEVEGQIHVRALRTGVTRMVGPGIAPRPIPLTDAFVYLAEAAAPRAPAEPAGGEVRRSYEVMQAGFVAGAPERLGTLTGTARDTFRGGYSPVRWMIVGEGAGGFTIRGAGLDEFALPNPFVDRPAGRDAAPSDPARPSTSLR